jgi:hypothetical protein
MNTTLKPDGSEVPDNEGAVCTDKTELQYNDNNYDIVIKTSRKALFDMAGVKIYSLVQILNKQGREVMHEIFPTILTDQQIKKIKKNINKNPQDYIN